VAVPPSDDNKGQYSTEGRVTGHGLHGHHPDWFRAPPSPYPNSTGGSFPELKLAGREYYHSPPSSAKAKNMWIHALTSPYTSQRIITSLSISTTKLFIIIIIIIINHTLKLDIYRVWQK
jgi:hypothetical protein